MAESKLQGLAGIDEAEHPTQLKDTFFSLHPWRYMKYACHLISIELINKLQELEEEEEEEIEKKQEIDTIIRKFYELKGITLETINTQHYRNLRKLLSDTPNSQREFIIGPVLQKLEEDEEKKALLFCNQFSHAEHKEPNKKDFQKDMYQKDFAGKQGLDKQEIVQAETSWKITLLSWATTLTVALGAGFIAFACVLALGASATYLPWAIVCGICASLCNIPGNLSDAKTTFYELKSGTLLKHADDTPFTTKEKILTKTFFILSVLGFGTTIGCAMAYFSMESLVLLGLAGSLAAFPPIAIAGFMVFAATVAIVLGFNTYRAMINAYKAGVFKKFWRYLKNDFFSWKTKNGYNARSFQETCTVLGNRFLDTLCFLISVGFVAALSSYLTLIVWKVNIVDISTKVWKLNRSAANVMSFILSYILTAVPRCLFAIMAAPAIGPFLRFFLWTVPKNLLGTTIFLAESVIKLAWGIGNLFAFNHKPLVSFFKSMWNAVPYLIKYGFSSATITIAATKIGDAVIPGFQAASAFVFSAGKLPPLFIMSANCLAAFSIDFKYFCLNRLSAFAKRKNSMVEEIYEQISKTETAGELVALFNYLNIKHGQLETLKRQRNKYQHIKHITPVNKIPFFNYTRNRYLPLKLIATIVTIIPTIIANYFLTPIINRVLEVQKINKFLTGTANIFISVINFLNPWNFLNPYKLTKSHSRVMEAFRVKALLIAASQDNNEEADRLNAADNPIFHGKRVHGFGKNSSKKIVLGKLLNNYEQNNNEQNEIILKKYQARAEHMGLTVKTKLMKKIDSIPSAAEAMEEYKQLYKQLKAENKNLPSSELQMRQVKLILAILATGREDILNNNDQHFNYNAIKTLLDEKEYSGVNKNKVMRTILKDIKEAVENEATAEYKLRKIQNEYSLRAKAVGLEGPKFLKDSIYDKIAGANALAALIQLARPNEKIILNNSTLLYAFKLKFMMLYLNQSNTQSNHTDNSHNDGGEITDQQSQDEKAYDPGKILKDTNHPVTKLITQHRNFAGFSSLRGQTKTYKDLDKINQLDTGDLEKLQKEYNKKSQKAGMADLVPTPACAA